MALRTQPEHREMLALADLDDGTLRDIGLRRTDLYAIPAKRLIQPRSCRTRRRRWSTITNSLRRAFSFATISCCPDPLSCR
ncbi:DUF1127 domain-containing protein [Microvirga brassicacearum]|nr:DUF1127 domain-containing protein [Microvirga brassicacearum]